MLVGLVDHTRSWIFLHHCLRLWTLTKGNHLYRRCIFGVNTDMYIRIKSLEHLCRITFPLQFFFLNFIKLGLNPNFRQSHGNFNADTYQSSFVVSVSKSVINLTLYLWEVLTIFFGFEQNFCFSLLRHYRSLSTHN